MLHNPYCSPSTSRAIKISDVNYISPGLVYSARLSKSHLALRRDSELDYHSREIGAIARKSWIGLTAETLEPNAAAKPGHLFGLDYIFLIKK